MVETGQERFSVIVALVNCHDSFMPPKRIIHAALINQQQITCCQISQVHVYVIVFIISWSHASKSIQDRSHLQTDVVEWSEAANNHCSKLSRAPYLRRWTLKKAGNRNSIRLTCEFNSFCFSHRQLVPTTQTSPLFRHPLKNTMAAVPRWMWLSVSSSRQQ